MLGELFDVAEHATQTHVGIPKRNRAQSGGVDEQATAGKRHQFARRRRVPAALVVRAHVTGRLHVGADECVHERRLPNTGRADQRNRCADVDVVAQCVETRAGSCADRNGVDHGCSSVRSLERSGDVVGVDEVELREHDHGNRTALEREHELTLEAPHVGSVRERLHNERDVDVRGHNLGTARTSFERITAHEGRTAGQHVADALSGEQHPIADGERLARFGPSAHRARFGQHGCAAEVDTRDAPRQHTRTADVDCHLRPAIVPSERGEVGSRVGHLDQRTLSACAPRSHC